MLGEREVVKAFRACLARLEDEKTRETNPQAFQAAYQVYRILSFDQYSPLFCFVFVCFMTRRWDERIHFLFLILFVFSLKFIHLSCIYVRQRVYQSKIQPSPN